MPTTATKPGNPLFLEPIATEHARAQVDSLLCDLYSGAWEPSALERRIAEILMASTAGDGMLTARRVRAALWEGSVTITYENGGRFATVLGDLVPVLDHPELTSLDIVDAAGELVAAVSEQG